MSLYYLQKQYYDTLKNNDNEFLKKDTRLYFLLRNLTYRGDKIDVAVPIRTNIQAKYLCQTIPLPPTSHTQRGCIGGWHLNKLIPVDGMVLYANKTHITKELRVAEFIGKTYLIEFKIMAQDILDKFAKKEKVYGSINFDKALTLLKQLNNKPNN